METTRFEASKFRNWWSIPRARFQRHNRRSGNAEPPLCHGNEEETPEVWVFTLADHFDIKGWQYTINICLMMVNIWLIYG